MEKKIILLHAEWRLHNCQLCNNVKFLVSLDICNKEVNLLSYVRVKEERPGKKLRRAHVLFFLSLTLHLGLTKPSRPWVGQLGEEKRRQCGDFWTKKWPKFFCINSVRRFFLLKCVWHTCVAFRSLLLMSNLGYFPNRSFLFCFVSAYLCDQRDGEAEVQSMKAEFK